MFELFNPHIPGMETHLAREKLFVNKASNYFRFCVSK